MICARRNGAHSGCFGVKVLCQIDQTVRTDAARTVWLDLQLGGDFEVFEERGLQ